MDTELEASGRLGTKPNAIKNAECCSNLLIGYLMFLLAFFKLLKWQEEITVWED